MEAKLDDEFLNSFSRAISEASNEYKVDGSEMTAHAFARLLSDNYEILLYYARLMKEKGNVDESRWALRGLLSEAPHSCYLDDKRGF